MHPLEKGDPRMLQALRSIRESGPRLRFPFPLLSKPECFQRTRGHNLVPARIEIPLS